MVEERLQQNRPSRNGDFISGVQRGLRDVYVDRTEVSLIDGERGKLSYRGYSIDSLAEHSTFEEVCYLMLYGALPTQDQLDRFDADLKSERRVPGKILSLLRDMGKMLLIDTLRTVVSAMSGSDAETAGDSHQVAIRSGIRITACAPTILAAHFRMRRGEEPVAPNGDLGHSPAA